MPATSPALPSLPGLRLLTHLGTGPSGQVYRARDLARGREVAVKLLEPRRVTPRGLARFAQTARAALAVDGACAAEVLDVAETPVRSAADLGRLEAFCAEVRADRPLVADDSVDVVLSNCVLNLVRPEDKVRLFDEMFRVLRRGGRVAISDIVSDEDVPLEMQRNSDLWSGCISGAFREDAFLEAFDRAGFYGMEVVKRDEIPWRIVDGIEFRSVTVVAWKGKQGPCLERNQAVIYRGPWKKVIDDDGHVLERGKRMAVCDKTFGIYGREPYADHVVRVAPYDEIPLEEASQFDCRRTAVRDARETKGLDYHVTDLSGPDCCEPGSDCC